MNKNSWKGKVEESPVSIDLVDSENQFLEFRVGQVFFETGKPKIGLWICYQKKFMAGNQQGPVLMDKSNWKKIKNYIDKKFRRKDCLTKIPKKERKKING